MIRRLTQTLMYSFLVVLLTCLVATHIEAGTLSGKITNIKGDPIRGIWVTADSGGWIAKKRTDDDGKFSFYVRDGIYKIYTDSWIGRLSYKDDWYMPKGFISFFRPTTRASIAVSSDEKVVVNIILLEAYAIADDSIHKAEELISEATVGYSHVLPHSILEYDIIGFGKEIGNYLNIVVQYGSRYLESGKVYYKANTTLNESNVFGATGLFPGVVFSYDKITIYADTIIYDQRRDSLDLIGNVVYETGVERKKHRKIRITLKNKRPTITVVA